MKTIDKERAHLLDPEHILAITIYGEARGEPIEGKIAVGNVIKNRMLDKRWPDTYVDVCTQPWQFSCWNDNDPNYEILSKKLKDTRNLDQSMSWKECLIAAWAVVKGYVRDNTGGANHYHTPQVSPAWKDKMARTVTIGNHIFYKG